MGRDASKEGVCHGQRRAEAECEREESEEGQWERRRQTLSQETDGDEEEGGDGEGSFGQACAAEEDCLVTLRDDEDRAEEAQQQERIHQVEGVVQDEEERNRGLEETEEEGEAEVGGVQNQVGRGVGGEGEYALERRWIDHIMFHGELGEEKIDGCNVGERERVRGG